MVNIYGAPNCILVSNNTLPYPHCCPQPVCSEFSNDLDPASEDNSNEEEAKDDVIIESYDVTMGGDDYDYSQESSGSSKFVPKESEELLLVCLRLLAYLVHLFK